MDNQEIIGKLYKLQMRLKETNPALALALEGANIPLLEHEGELAKASRSELLKIEGVGNAVAGIVARIAAGEHIYDIFLSLKGRKKEKGE